MLWGIARPPGVRLYNADENRTTYFLSELRRKEPALLEPEHRCLIVMDSFALPDGPKGARTRTWFGYEDRPIFGWAGVWREGEIMDRFAGLIVDAGPDVEVQRIMPAIVPPEDYDVWLTGTVTEAVHIAARRLSGAGLYREPTEQPWGADRT